jgi:hypothetical protein
MLLLGGDRMPSMYRSLKAKGHRSQVFNRDGEMYASTAVDLSWSSLPSITVLIIRSLRPEQRPDPGVRWSNCEFDDDVAFARDRKSGCPRALVAVTISFEAIPGGGMEDVEAVGNLRAATVVFRLDGPEWEVDGKAYFNLSPAQTIDYYHNELETVD